VNRSSLHHSYVEVLNRFSPHLTHAVTLTFKKRAFIQPKTFEKCVEGQSDIWVWCERNQPQYKWNNQVKQGFWCSLNEQIAEDTIRYFYSKLSFIAFGKDSKRTSTKSYSQPLMITSFEGGDRKRLHAHLAIGNLPAHLDVRNAVERAWFACDFGHKQIKIKPLTNTHGWLNYITKEMNIGHIDTLNIQSIREPQSYLRTLA